MSKEGVSFKNRDRFIQLGIAISTLRKLRGMSQDQLAEKANMSRSHLSAIEAPNMIRSFSLETLFNLADASSSRSRISAGSVIPARWRVRSISSCAMGRYSHVICSVSSGSDFAVTATVMAFGS